MISEKDRQILQRFGEHLRKLREERGLSYRDFAKRSGLNTGDIVAYENGRTAPIFLSIKKLAIGLGKHPKELLDFDFGIDFFGGLE